MNVFDILKERGFIHTVSHEKELREALGKGPITFYLGIDPTADDLHIGHFFAVRVFSILQSFGHKGILLLGGATGQIGDPSDKNDMRKLMTTKIIDDNVASIKNVLTRFINLNKTTFVNNADWTRNQSYLEFMQNVGTHFNVSDMLSKDCYKNRLGNGLTFFEMGYMLLQAYDFIHLNNTYGCTLQIGGTDQWSNILAGVELGRKMSLENGKSRPAMMGLCNPLLTKSDGTKMGKTEKGALWITPEKCSPYDFYQYFINVDDRDVEKLLKFFTMIPITEITQMCKTDIIGAKKLMAFEITKLIHGEQIATQQINANFTTGENAPTETINTTDRNIVDVLSQTSVISSKREAREFIQSGAISINGERVDNVNTVLPDSFLLKKGKKTFIKITLQ